MRELFLSVLNMSFTASYVILFVMLVRLLLKKAPKGISYVLWGVVAFRLIIPFSFESMFSLLPRSMNTVPISHDIIYQQSPPINSGLEVLDSFTSESLPAPTIGASINPLQIFIEVGAYLWILGIIVLLIYSLVSVLLLKRQLKSAELIEQNIFEAKNLKTPFVLGLISPKIYLPVGLNVEERGYILLHEKTHIHRKDYIIKMLAFLILSIHWFNPLVWIAFMLMNTDMELSCDEQVLKEMNEDIKKPYANLLLSLATGKNILSSSPLAFGEGNIKGRIKNVLNYKKPRFWIVDVAIIAVILIVIGLIANPQSYMPTKSSATESGADGLLGIKVLKQTNLEPTVPELYPEQIVGVDMAELDYASDDILIFHGYFGMFVYDLNSLQIIRSLDLKPLNCHYTQGDNYCDVSVSLDGNKVQLHPMSSENMFTYTVSNNTLKEATNNPMTERFKSQFVSIEEVLNSTKLGNYSHHAVRFDTGEFGYLYTEDGTISTLSYVRGNRMYTLFGFNSSAEKGEFISLTDVNWDNREESIYLDKSQIKEGLVTLHIVDVSGVELWIEQLSTSHAGWDQIFLCELNNKQYLLRYNPTMYQGYCTYVYTLFTLENGKEKIYSTNKLEFDINGTKGLDVQKMIAFANEVNELLSKSTLLISSNGGNFSFGPSSAEPFFERFSWLDGYKELFKGGDSLETKLNKFSDYAVSNRKLMDITNQ